MSVFLCGQCNTRAQVRTINVDNSTLMSSLRPTPAAHDEHYTLSDGKHNTNNNNDTNYHIVIRDTHGHHAVMAIPA